MKDSDLRAWAGKKIGLAEWESHLAEFITNWFSDTGFIEVNTSGSTGLPKVIRHSKSAMMQSATMTCDFFKLEPGMNALLCMSTRNIAGMMMVVRSFVRQLNLIPVPPDGRPLKSLPISASIDFCAMVPAQLYNSIVNEPDRNRLSCIRNLIIGGAPVSHRLSEMIKELNCNVWLTFGMTETMSHIALRKLNGSDASDYFEVLEGVEISSGEEGNLIVKVPFIGDELIVTNDLVEIVAPGKFRWLGRKDHVIISGGFKIFPEVVEQTIAPVVEKFIGEMTGGIINSATDSTLRFFIAPMPDDKLGEIPVLVIEGDFSDDQKQHAEKLLTELLSSIVKKHEIPRRFFFMPRFIETPTHKIIRSATVKRLLSAEH